MDAPEFENLIARALSRAIKEGVAENKLDFIYMIGILENQKQKMIELNRAFERESLKQSESRIVRSGN